VVVEDLISTGGSSLKAVEDLRHAGFEVLGMVAIFSYGFEVADKNFNEAGVPLVCLSNYDALLPQAVAENYINQSTLASLAEWRKNPGGWMQ
jgi:orotate phosphoribosyltransferase